MIQLTDFKIADIKLGDIFSLLMIPYFLLLPPKLKGENLFRHIIWAITLSLVSSYIVLLWVDLFPISQSSLLKAPGVISFSRYLQYLGCVFFAWTIQVKIKSTSIENQKKFFVFIDSQMFYWGVIFLLFWGIAVAGVDNPFVFGPDHRLKGGYVEGGPFGLMYATYFMFRTSLIGFSKRWLFLLAMIVGASQSKAAVLFLLATALLLYFPLTQRSKGMRVILPACLAVIFIGASLRFNLAERLDEYQTSMESPEDHLGRRTNDPSYIAGRISASYIAPRMFKDNMLLGVGMGNYSLTRNNPIYLGPFPYLDAWDLTGLGGLVNYALEGGIVGLAILIVPFLVFWIKNSKLRPVAYAAFILFFISQLFGVQMYFQYIWLPLAALTSLRPEMWSIARRIIRQRYRHARLHGESVVVAENPRLEAASHATC